MGGEFHQAGGEYCSPVSDLAIGELDMDVEHEDEATSRTRARQEWGSRRMTLLHHRDLDLDRAMAELSDLDLDLVKMRLQIWSWVLRKRASMAWI